MTEIDSRPLFSPDGSVVHTDPEVHSGTPVFVGTRPIDSGNQRSGENNGKAE